MESKLEEKGVGICHHFFTFFPFLKQNSHDDIKQMTQEMCKNQAISKIITAPFVKDHSNETHKVQQQLTSSWASLTLWDTIRQSWNHRTNPIYHHDFILYQTTLSNALVLSSNRSIIIGFYPVHQDIDHLGEYPYETHGYRINLMLYSSVAGPLKDIETEYIQQGDLLWIDREEIYVTETFVLTNKTESFSSILYQHVVQSTETVQYLFKTGDDSHVALEKLYHVW